MDKSSLAAQRRQQELQSLQRQLQSLSEPRNHHKSADDGVLLDPQEQQRPPPSPTCTDSEHPTTPRNVKSPTPPSPTSSKKLNSTKSPFISPKTRQAKPPIGRSVSNVSSSSTNSDFRQEQAVVDTLKAAIVGVFDAARITSNQKQPPNDKNHPATQNTAAKQLSFMDSLYSLSMSASNDVEIAQEKKKATQAKDLSLISAALNNVSASSQQRRQRQKDPPAIARQTSDPPAPLLDDASILPLNIPCKNNYRKRKDEQEQGHIGTPDQVATGAQKPIEEEEDYDDIAPGTVYQGPPSPVGYENNRNHVWNGQHSEFKGTPLATILSQKLGNNVSPSDANLSQVKSETTHTTMPHSNCQAPPLAASTMSNDSQSSSPSADLFDKLFRQPFNAATSSATTNNDTAASRQQKQQQRRRKSVSEMLFLRKSASSPGYTMDPILETPPATTCSSSCKPTAQALARWKQVREHVTSGAFLVPVTEAINNAQATSCLCDACNTKDFSASKDESCDRSRSSSISRRGSMKDILSPYHQQRVRKIYRNIQKSIKFSSAYCLVAVVGYIIMSVIIFSYVFEKWTVIDSCYFAVTTMTTIGSGDLFPDTDIERIVTCVYVLSGVSFVAVALGMLGSHLIDAHETLTQKAKSFDQFKVMSLFSSTSSSSVKLPSFPDKWEGPWYRIHRVPLISALIGCTICFLAVLIGTEEGWDFKTTTYYVIITACTVGYGDLSPTSQYSRFLAVVFIPLVAMCMARCIQLIAEAIVNRRRSRTLQSFCGDRQLAVQDLDVMGSNGQVSWAEFLEFMLIAMGKVDKCMLDELRSHFDQLDVDQSGYLDMHDLIQRAKKESQNPRRKLELAMYKKRLLELSERQLFESPTQRNNNPHRSEDIGPCASASIRTESTGSSNHDPLLPSSESESTY